MKVLEDRILTEGRVLPGGILKVDSFLNHQIDPSLCRQMAEEFYRLFGDCGVNKVLTVEASGIALGLITAEVFGCRLVFAKKSKSRNIANDVYSAEVESFTHGNVNTVVVSREYLSAGDRLLLIDDFLATGAALIGLSELASQAGATVVGAGVAVEKAFQGGGEILKKRGIRVEALARIAAMDDHGLSFC